MQSVQFNLCLAGALLCSKALFPAAAHSMLDTVPDLTEQTRPKDILKLPSGKTIEVEMFEEVSTGYSTEESETRRKSDLSCVTPVFAGKVRKYSKTVPHEGRAKTFKSIAHLIAWLPSDSAMKFHLPAIDRTEASRRVDEEERNILLKKVWIHAVYREEDNDFHLILCDKQIYDETAALFSAEISGLPEPGLVSEKMYQNQVNVRSALTEVLGDLSCTRTYIFKKGGLPVQVRGSLFFDVHHAGQKHGRQGLYPKSAWEIHPVTAFKWLEE